MSAQLTHPKTDSRKESTTSFTQQSTNHNRLADSSHAIDPLWSCHGYQAKTGQQEDITLSDCGPDNYLFTR